MNTIYITRRETFNAAHKLWQEEWSEEKNWEVFGKCSNHNWHGHNFELWVTVKGTPDPETGFIMNLKLLSQLVKIHVIEALDHKNLNLDVADFANLNPTAEEIAEITVNAAKTIKKLKIAFCKAKSDHNFPKKFETVKNILEKRGG